MSNCNWVSCPVLLERAISVPVSCKANNCNFSGRSKRRRRGEGKNARRVRRSTLISRLIISTAAAETVELAYTTKIRVHHNTRIRCSNKYTRTIIIYISEFFFHSFYSSFEHKPPLAHQAYDYVGQSHSGFFFFFVLFLTPRPSLVWPTARARSILLFHRWIYIYIYAGQQYIRHGPDSQLPRLVHKVRVKLVSWQRTRQTEYSECSKKPFDREK